MRQPFIIGIGGAHSGSGKTTLAVAILKTVTSNKSKVTSNEKSNGSQNQSIKASKYQSIKDSDTLTLGNSDTSSVARYSLLNKRWGAIKYTKTAFYSSITDEITILRQKDKDTKKLLDAGAEEALWVQSPADNIEEVMPLALERFSGLDGIIVEGNSAIEFLKPDIVIFLLGVAAKTVKPSAKAVFEHADIIVCNDMQAVTGLLKNKKLQPQVFSLSLLNIRELIVFMEAVIQKKEIAGFLKANASLNEISCSLARKIAEDLGVTYSDVGKAADELEIKIRNCELDCF